MSNAITALYVACMRADAAVELDRHRRSAYNVPIAKNTSHGIPSFSCERAAKSREEKTIAIASRKPRERLDRCRGHIDDGKRRTSEQDLFDDGSDGDSVEQCCR